MSESARIARAYEQLEGNVSRRWESANRGNQLIVAERRMITRRLLDQEGLIPIGDRSVLEVGSGGGGELAGMVDLGANPARLCGLDLLPRRVAAAREAHPGIEYRVGNAESIEFPDETFDLAMAITLFSSIRAPEMAFAVAGEIVRVLRPGGALLFYDFRYPSPANRNVRPVRARDVRRLFPQLRGDLQSITVLPPLARRLGVLTDAAYTALSRVPPLRSHLIGVLRKE
jgi:ubiquinone/menaquinone biosynthesis C-methylase UbiE